MITHSMHQSLGRTEI